VGREKGKKGGGFPLVSFPTLPGGKRERKDKENTTPLKGPIPLLLLFPFPGRQVRKVGEGERQGEYTKLEKTLFFALDRAGFKGGKRKKGGEGRDNQGAPVWGAVPTYLPHVIAPTERGGGKKGGGEKFPRLKTLKNILSSNTTTFPFLIAKKERERGKEEKKNKQKGTGSPGVAPRPPPVNPFPLFPGPQRGEKKKKRANTVFFFVNGLQSSPPPTRAKAPGEKKKEKKKEPGKCHDAQSFFFCVCPRGGKGKKRRGMKKRAQPLTPVCPHLHY